VSLLFKTCKALVPPEFVVPTFTLCPRDLTVWLETEKLPSAAFERCIAV
jgi:hypothetical protein